MSQLGQSPTLRPLLAIPAAGSAGRSQGRGQTGSGATGSGATAAGAGSTAAGGADAAAIWTPMVLILAAIALLLGGVEIIRRRRVIGGPAA